MIHIQSLLLLLLLPVFKTIAAGMSVVTNCQTLFGTQPPSELLSKRPLKFLEVYNNSPNSPCHY